MADNNSILEKLDGLVARFEEVRGLLPLEKKLSIYQVEDL